MSDSWVGLDVFATVFGHDIIFYIKEIKRSKIPNVSHRVRKQVTSIWIWCDALPSIPTPCTPPPQKKISIPLPKVHVKNDIIKKSYQYKSVSCFNNSSFKLLVSFSNFEDNTSGKCEMKCDKSLIQILSPQAAQLHIYITSKDSMQEYPHHVLLRQAMLVV